MYVLSRTAGPPLGPHAHVPEPAGAIDLATTAAEVALVGVLLTLLGARSRKWTVNLLVAGGALLGRCAQRPAAVRRGRPAPSSGRQPRGPRAARSRAALVRLRAWRSSPAVRPFFRPGGRPPPAGGVRTLRSSRIADGAVTHRKAAHCALLSDPRRQPHYMPPHLAPPTHLH